VHDIKYAFDNLRDETDRPNEVKLSKVKTMPIFSSDDISRIPMSRSRIQDEMLLGQDSHLASQDRLKDMNELIQDESMRSRLFNLDSVRMEKTGIECSSMLCGCTSKPSGGISKE